MKRSIIYSIVAASTLLCAGCEDFLDTNNYTKKDTSNYPATLEDAEQVVTGVYATLSKAMASPADTYFYLAELAADDRLGGGGENDKDMQGFDKLMNTKDNRMGTFWETRYKGIFRANMALETMGNCEGFTSEAQKNQMLGEVHFLRAFFYHELAEAFGNVPLVLSTEPVNLPKAETDELYGLIASDLQKAIELMPAQPYTSVESGHATRWAAEALMARVFLFYTGFYGKDALPVRGDDGTISGNISREQVVSWVDDCIANSGHSLVGDFRELWAYTNEYTAPDYPYAEGLKWVGDGNEEVVFAIKGSTLANWNSNSAGENATGLSNQYVLHFSLRANNGTAGTFPFGQGWGAGPVNTSLWNEWKTDEPGDVRREASILDVETECENYLWGADKQMEETGLWQKKYIVIRAWKDKEAGTLYNTFSTPMWGGGDDFQLGHAQDLVLIRFADVLLMQSELKQDAAGINRVRQRAGLAPVGAYSLDVLKKERRYELCFEGRRWADIRRWGDAPALLDKQIGLSVKNKGVDAVMKAFGGGYSARYEATKGFFAIPETQVALSEGVLEQNPGWGTADSNFTGW